MEVTIILFTISSIFFFTVIDNITKKREIIIYVL